jgi:ferritin-like metal-binding protein YciE
MPDGSEPPLLYSLSEAVSAERNFEARFRDFAKAASVDSEVQSVFTERAEQSRAHQNRLAARLADLGREPANGAGEVGSLADIIPKITQLAPPAEELVLQHLLAAYTIEAGGCAMYEAFATAARVVNDKFTEDLLREIQADERAAAEKIWRFLSSRSKIAFNMLTVNEVDPAVDTKMADDRIIEP